MFWRWRGQPYPCRSGPWSLPDRLATGPHLRRENCPNRSRVDRRALGRRAARQQESQDRGDGTGEHDFDSFARRAGCVARANAARDRDAVTSTLPGQSTHRSHGSPQSPSRTSGVDEVTTTIMEAVARSGNRIACRGLPGHAAGSSAAESRHRGLIEVLWTRAEHVRAFRGHHCGCSTRRIAAMLASATCRAGICQICGFMISTDTPPW